MVAMQSRTAGVRAKQEGYMPVRDVHSSQRARHTETSQRTPPGHCPILVPTHRTSIVRSLARLLVLWCKRICACRDWRVPIIAWRLATKAPLGLSTASVMLSSAFTCGHYIPGWYLVCSGATSVAFPLVTDGRRPKGIPPAPTGVGCSCATSALAG